MLDIKDYRSCGTSNAHFGTWIFGILVYSLFYFSVVIETSTLVSDIVIKVPHIDQDGYLFFNMFNILIFLYPTHKTRRIYKNSALITFDTDANHVLK